MRRVVAKVVLISALLAGLLVPGAGAAIKLSTRSHVELLPGGGLTGAATASCPARAWAIGGGARLADLDDYVQGSFPLPGQAWTAAGWSSAPAGDEHTVTAIVRCLKGAKVSTRSRAVPLPPGGQGASVVASCPRGSKVVGGGVRLGDDVNDYVIASHPSGERGWTATAWRSDFFSDPSSVSAFARCLEARNAQVTTKRAAVTVPPTNELRRAVATCPRGSRLLAGGVRLATPEDDYLRGTHPGSGPRSWVAVGSRGEGGPTSTLTAFARCLH